MTKENTLASTWKAWQNFEVESEIWIYLLSDNVGVVLFRTTQAEQKYRIFLIKSRSVTMLAMLKNAKCQVYEEIEEAIGIYLLSECVEVELLYCWTEMPLYFQ